MQRGKHGFSVRLLLLISIFVGDVGMVMTEGKSHWAPSPVVQRCGMLTSFVGCAICDFWSVLCVE